MFSTIVLPLFEPHAGGHVKYRDAEAGKSQKNEKRVPHVMSPDSS
jgi:hypothetical protein